MIENICSNIEPEIVTLIHNIITLIKIAVPIALVIFGMIDFAKGVMAGKEDEVKKGQNNFIKRLIAGAVVFLMITVAQLVVSIFDKDSNGGFWNCADAIMNGETDRLRKFEDNDCCEKYNGKYVEGKCVFENANTDTIVEYHNCVSALQNK